jgi:hypothetical protein
MARGRMPYWEAEPATKAGSAMVQGWYGEDDDVSQAQGTRHKAGQGWAGHSRWRTAKLDAELRSTFVCSTLHRIHGSEMTNLCLTLDYSQDTMLYKVVVCRW